MKKTTDAVISERQKQILHIALEIIADEGYSSLTMRHLARASGMKLGALQYHFRTWEALMRAMVEYLGNEFRELLIRWGEPLTIQRIAKMMLTEDAQTQDRVWPQLWAMQQVEPLVSDLLKDIYEEYLLLLETALKNVGNPSPRAEALCLMALLESEVLFTGQGRPWESDRSAMHKAILDFIDIRYGE